MRFSYTPLSFLLFTITFTVFGFRTLHAESWTVIPSGTTLRLNGLTIANYKTAYIAADKGTVIKTTDAGISWKAQRFAVGFGGPMHGIASTDSSVAIAV